jgi:hypothetical protein
MAVAGPGEWARLPLPFRGVLPIPFPVPPEDVDLAAAAHVANRLPLHVPPLFPQTLSSPPLRVICKANCPAQSPEVVAHVLLPVVVHPCPRQLLIMVSSSMKKPAAKILYQQPWQQIIGGESDVNTPSS